ITDLVEEQRPADSRADEPLLVCDRAGETPAPMSEQPTIREFPRRSRGVVGEEHRRASGRAHMNRARNEILARAALAGDEHGQVVSLESLNLVGQPIHRRSSTDEPWEKRFERSTVLLIHMRAWTPPCPPHLETLSR